MLYFARDGLAETRMGGSNPLRLDRGRPSVVLPAVQGTIPVNSFADTA
jgi:hypothetical protein